jgi:hypothetical protein
MMPSIRTLVVVAYAALNLVGCATVPSSAPAYQREAAAQGDLVNVYIYRVGANPTKRTPTIYVDEKEVFDPPEYSYTVIRLAPGKHSVATKWSWDTGAPNLSFVVEVPKTTSYYLKLTGDFKATGLTYKTTSLARHVEPEVAEAELKNCCKYISNRF